MIKCACTSKQGGAYLFQVEGVDLERTGKMIRIESVQSVYSGRDGACCCGCAGKHSYASSKIEAASKARGYAVTTNEVNDRMIKKVVGLLNNAESVEVYSDHASTVVNGRLYIAYFEVQS